MEDALRRSGYNVRYRAKLRGAVLKKLGNKCRYCGFLDPRALQIDHVYGNGSEDATIRTRNYAAYFKKILADTSGSYQLLCANCNWIKRAENKEYRK